MKAKEKKECRNNTCQQTPHLRADDIFCKKKIKEIKHMVHVHGSLRSHVKGGGGGGGGGAKILFNFNRGN